MTLIQRIMLHEGLVLKPYKDTLGHWTIGYGHKILPNETFDAITPEQAKSMLMDDIATARKQTYNAFPWLIGLDEIRQGVIIEMVFQLGIGGVSKFQKMIAAIRERDYNRAADEMLNSRWARQTPRRCKTLADLMRG